VERPEAHYWCGVIAWTLAFNDLSRSIAEAQKNGGAMLRDEDVVPSAIRVPFMERQGGLMDDGIQHLERVRSLDPNFIEAGFYLSYLYRLRSRGSAEASERKQYLGRTDAWFAAITRNTPQEPRELRPIIPPPPPAPPEE